MRGRVGAAALMVVTLVGCSGEVTGGGDSSDGSADDDGDGDGDGRDDGGGDGGGAVPSGVGDGPAVERGGQFFGAAEQFNRYYTDPDWTPSRTIYASPGGGGDGSSADQPTTLPGAAVMLEPGTLVRLAAGTYPDTCIGVEDSQSGTYDDPIVFAGELADDGAPTAVIECCGDGRAACFNIEAADHVAIDSVELVGGEYGVRAVGADFAADQHQVGVAVLRSIGHDQENDPFFTGQSDWFVIEAVVAYGAGQSDGHGIYLSNGSDWLIVRDSELFENSSSDFQINADPIFTCEDDGVSFDDPECDAVAGEHPTGGRGASDFALVERNYFHDGFGPGPNFTSVRNSVVRNNVFAAYERHGTSFWQETDNPALGSRGNRVVQNLFVTTSGDHAVQFIESSTDNLFAQNVLLGLSLGGAPIADPGALLLEADESVGGNTYARNAYVGGWTDGHEPGDGELREEDLDAAWFAGFPLSLQHAVDGFVPLGGSPWVAVGEVLDDAPGDMRGQERSAPTSLGPLLP